MTELIHGIVDSVRAPRENNLAAIVPDRSSLSSLLAANRVYWQSSNVPLWIRSIRESARRQLAELVSAYAGSYLSGSISPSTELFEDRAWILGGHQPELFHPGVWFKNILIDRLARETNSLGWNAMIDHDLARATSIRVPARDLNRHRAHTVSIPLPLEGPSTSDPFLPWNAWRLDRSKIQSTVRAIEQALSSVGITGSMATDFFHELESLPLERNAALAFSQVRHRIEHRHGIGNWEFPMSSLCRCRAWQAFVGHCIEHATELNQAYNDCLEEYRARERITNPTQPVPRLGRTGPWIELPFWLQLPGQFSRRRMWVVYGRSHWHIAPEPDPAVPSMTWTEPTGDASWLVLPRALTTTLFLRTFIADLFVHGIGGGLYDRLTDAIIARFLRIVPPKFVTCTATLWLAFPNEQSRDERRFAQQARALEATRQQLRSYPERYLDMGKPEQRNLAAEHRQLLALIPPRGQRKTWDREIRALKARIVAAIEPHRLAWDASKGLLEDSISEQKILTSREYPYVLFQEQDILDRLLQLAKPECENT